MLPALAWIGFGQSRFWIPLPTFLLWPFWLIGWLVWAPMRLFRVPGYRKLGLVLSLSGRLSGLQLDISSKKGPQFRVRLT